MLALVVDRINQTWDAGVDEGRIADDGHCPLKTCLLKAVGIAHAGTHAVVDACHLKGR